MSEISPSSSSQKEVAKAPPMPRFVDREIRYFFLWGALADPAKIQQILGLDCTPTLQEGCLLGHEVVEGPNGEKFLAKTNPYSVKLSTLLTGRVFKGIIDNEVPIDNYLKRTYNGEVVLKMSLFTVTGLGGRVGRAAILERKEQSEHIEPTPACKSSATTDQK